MRGPWVARGDREPHVRQEFADREKVLGLRFRRTGPHELSEIVGVIHDFPGFPRAPGSEGEPTVYYPAALGDLPPAVLSIRFKGTIPFDVAERLRRIGAEVDPALQLQRVVPLSDFYDEVRSLVAEHGAGRSDCDASVLLLSAAGVHALMSFTIAQRTREIGIRSALGAPTTPSAVGHVRPRACVSSRSACSPVRSFRWWRSLLRG